MLNKQSMPLTGFRSFAGVVLDKLFHKRIFPTAILAALLARVVIGEGLRPFAIPFFTAAVAAHPVWIGLSTVLGYFSAGRGGILWLLLPLVPIFLIRIRAPTRSSGGLVLLAVGGQIAYRIPTFMGPMLGYDWMLLLMELSLAATGALIFRQAGLALRQEIPAADEGLERSLALVVTAVVALTSIAGIKLGPFNLLALVVGWLILAAASAGGSGAGACTGIVAGILAGYGHVYPAVVVSTLAVAGLLAGIFSQWGRWGTFAGFAVGILAMLVYGGYPSVALGFADLIGAGLLFLLTPARVSVKARRLLVSQNGEWAWEYQQRLRRAMILKLQKLALIFSRLANSFRNTSGVEGVAGNHLQMSRMFDHLSCAVCTGCINYKRCWEKELYSTYSQLMDYLTSSGEAGSGFDGLLSRRCHNIEQLLSQAESLYRQYASERRWAAKVNECKDVVSEQLRGVSEVLAGLSKQIRLDVNCRQDLEGDLAERLTNWGVEVMDLSVAGTERNLPQVSIQAKVPAGENPLGAIQAMVSDVMGQPLQLVENVPARDANKLIFAVPVKYYLELGVAQSAKDDVSGDCFNHLQTASDKHAYLLSDGMGKGNRARAESDQALCLARDMLEAGFSAETAIKAINSLLVLRGNERFATLDLAVIDVARGQIDIYKTGAAPSFLKSGGEVELISGAGLPIGIVPGIEPRQAVRAIREGDCLVMVSDGMVDGQDRDEDWLANQLKLMGNIAAPAMAKQLLNRADRAGSNFSDDATVIVVRVREAKKQAYWNQRAV
ncbi:MAG TPA: hypothetical protein DDY38_06645 [Firmicutes bacterium]|nr:hypothetical protein [Bacillota bacterium]